MFSSVFDKLCELISGPKYRIWAKGHLSAIPFPEDPWNKVAQTKLYQTANCKLQTSNYQQKTDLINFDTKYNNLCKFIPQFCTIFAGSLIFSTICCKWSQFIFKLYICCAREIPQFLFHTSFPILLEYFYHNWCSYLHYKIIGDNYLSKIFSIFQYFQII